MAKPHLPKRLKTFWKNHDYLWIYIAIVTLAVGSSWLADEIPNIWNEENGVSWGLLGFGLILTIIGYFLARRLSKELSAPRHETFHSLGGNHEKTVLNQTQKVIMFLSNLDETLYDQMVADLKAKQWDKVIASEVGISKKEIKCPWQQNYRSINIFKEFEGIEIRVFCSEKSFDQFDAFKEIYDHHREHNGFKLHNISRYPDKVDIHSLYNLSQALKDEVEQRQDTTTIIDITSGTKQYSAAATLETIATEDIYILYIDNNGTDHHLYNVRNETKNNGLGT